MSLKSLFRSYVSPAGTWASWTVWPTIALIVILALIVRDCQAGRAVQVKQDIRSASAAAQTAQAAAVTVTGRAAADASIDQLVNATILEVENATDTKISGSAARAAICRMPDYRNDPAC